MKLWIKLTATLTLALAVFGLSGARTAQADSHTAFITRLSKPVLQASKKYHLYGSVMMAQAALESDWGTSTLSTEANNYFGVKGTYSGQSVTMSTSEADGSGQFFNTMAQFKSYPSLQASINDYAQTLRDGTTWNPFLYENTWRENATSYTEAVDTIAQHYATDTNYASKIETIIAEYDLTSRFDDTTSNSDDATTTKITPGVSYATDKGTATIKSGSIKLYQQVPGPSVDATSSNTSALAGKKVTIQQRGIIKSSQTIWYQIKSGSTTGWVQLTDLLNLQESH
ncbi:glycoside hydrolase family 73 protein [Secundilactobacillus collinoides]|nr:glucosaminidase domain-containing protein [Secundilactobacillus collinoides]